MSARGKVILHVACSIAMGVAWHPAAGVFWFAWDPWDLILPSRPSSPGGRT